MSSFVKASGNIMPNSADPGEEFPFLHTITVVDRVVSVDKPELVQNNIKTETVTLNLDSEWEGLSTVINIGNEKPVSVIWSGEPVVIPAELMTTVGSLDVSVVGYGDDGGIRAVTKKATSVFNVVASGFVEGDEAVPDPTTILGQLVTAGDKANKAAQSPVQQVQTQANQSLVGHIVTTNDQIPVSEVPQNGTLQHGDMTGMRMTRDMSTMTPDEQLNHLKTDVETMWRDATPEQRERIKESLTKWSTTLTV